MLGGGEVSLEVNARPMTMRNRRSLAVVQGRRSISKSFSRVGVEPGGEWSPPTASVALAGGMNARRVSVVFRSNCLVSFS